MKIGIDIDTIRNINPRIIKHYSDSIDNSFVLKDNESEEDVDIDKELIFKNKKEKNAFFHEDFVYEIYGCSNPFSSNLPSHLNEWMKKIYDIKIESEKHEKSFFKRLFGKTIKNYNSVTNVSLFGILSSELIIGSSLFFLSKISCRCREILFPTNSNELFNKFDVIITSNPKLLKNKKNNCILICINRKYNKKYHKNCDFIYDGLENMILDEELFNKINKII